MIKSFWKKVSGLKVGDKIAIVRPDTDIEKAELLPAVIASGTKQSKETETATPMARSDEETMSEETMPKAGSISALGRGTGMVDFDEIVSIKKVGREKVWDIEVEGTHNFVGNGILAHNTYINGNLGVGTTAPSSKLTINADSLGADTLIFNVQNTGSNVFKVDTEGDYSYDGTGSTPAADYAEYFKTIDVDLQAGEAVCIDTLNTNSVKRCTKAEETNIMGIVSTKPALVGNARPEFINNENYKTIAMLGQIPAKVSDENGAIRIGDSLTASSTPGYVMKANAGDSTVGVALEGFGDGSFAGAQDDNVQKGTIQVMISRRNKSITVESVEAKVTERVAAMKIEDEVKLLVANAVASLKPVNTLTLDENGNVTLTNDPTTTVDILANNAEIRNITDSLITLQSDYETLKNTTEERIGKIESTILTSVFEKEYQAETELEKGTIVSYNGTKVEKANGENRDTILGVVTSVTSSNQSPVIASGSEAISETATSGTPRSDESKATVTTRGRVKVQVTAENGEIKKGDAITGSITEAGKGTKAVTEGMIIGYALEDARLPSTTSQDVGGQAEIQIAISPIWYVGMDSSSTEATQNDGGVIPLGQVLSNSSVILSDSEGSSITSLLSLTVEQNTLLNGTLNVLGNASFADIFASGKISVGLLALSAEDNSINVTGDKLLLQNEFGAKDIEAFGGKIVFTSDGGIKVLGVIEADKIKVNELEVQDGITIKDNVTDEYYCVTMKDGVLVSTQGRCEIK